MSSEMGSLFGKVCVHGGLQRQCQTCGDAAEITSLREALAQCIAALEVTADNVRRLGPNGGPVFASYEVWLDGVEQALARAKSEAL